MIAILLAAGRGRRLGEMGRDIPKVLIDVAGRTLLQRHFDTMEACGVDRVRVVTGYHGDRVQKAVDAIEGYSGRIETIFNDRYEHGNILSLQFGLRGLGDSESILVMDADTLYPRRLLRRLLDSAHETCLLLDASSSFQDEEMMIAVGGGRVRRVTRGRPEGDWEVLGETVGFLKVAGSAIPALREAVEAVIGEGRLDAEYEEAYDEYFAPAHPIGHERVDELPWTEIDFPEDITKAVEEILPRVQRENAKD